MARHNRHKWEWSDTRRIATCQRCGCKIIKKINPNKRSVYSVFIEEYFVDKDGSEILLAGGVRVPPCEPSEEA